MHIIFTEKEREWVDTKKFGMPIKAGCPKDIEQSIKAKKKLLESQDFGNGR